MHRWGWWAAGLMAALALSYGLGRTLPGTLAALSPEATPTLLLTLRNAPAGGLTVPPVPGVTAVALPRYPGSTVISPRVPDALDPQLGESYGRTARRAVLAPARLSAVEEWYQSAMRRLGYRVVSRGGSGSVTAGLDTWMLAFAKPPLSPLGLTVTLNFHPEGARTAVQYWATEVVPPPRPGWLSPITGARAVVLRWTMGSAPFDRRRLTNPQAIALLEIALNRLDRVAPGDGGFCPSSVATVTATFVMGPTRRVTAVENTCGRAATIRGVALDDPGLTFWHAAARVLHLHLPTWMRNTNG